MIAIREIIESYNNPIRSGNIQRNPEFIRLVRDRVLDLIQRNETRISGINFGYYHDTINKEAIPYPYVLQRNTFHTGFDREVDNTTLREIVDTLTTLISYGIIGADDQIDVRRIDWDGDGSFIDGTNEELNEMLGKMGLPTAGQFIANDRRERPNFAPQTFTGIDATILAVVGNVVSEIDTLDTITITSHRGKPSAHSFNMTAPRSIARGTRTVAGTMIFNEGIEHPLLRIYPSSIMPLDNDVISGNNPDFNATLLVDQLPPFSLILIFQNEYGFAKMLTIYDIETTDEAFTYSNRDMIQQVVVEYKAVDYDAPMEVRVGKDGTIDPFELTKGGVSAFHERLWLMRNYNTLHDSPYEMTEEYYRVLDNAGQVRDDLTHV